MADHTEDLDGIKSGIEEFIKDYKDGKHFGYVEMSTKDLPPELDEEHIEKLAIGLANHIKMWVEVIHMFSIMPKVIAPFFWEGITTGLKMIVEHTGKELIDGAVGGMRRITDTLEEKAVDAPVIPLGCHRCKEEQQENLARIAKEEAKRKALEEEEVDWDKLFDSTLSDEVN